EGDINVSDERITPVVASLLGRVTLPTAEELNQAIDLLSVVGTNPRLAVSAIMTAGSSVELPDHAAMGNTEARHFANGVLVGLAIAKLREPQLLRDCLKDDEPSGENLRGAVNDAIAKAEGRVGLASCGPIPVQAELEDVRILDWLEEHTISVLMDEYVWHRDVDT